jgi:hypothetical protein
MAEWKTLFAGEKNGRLIKLEQYYEGNSLRLTTSPGGDSADDLSGSANSAGASGAGAPAALEIHAADAAQLQRRLVEEAGFSEVLAKEIAQLGHVESAAVPPPEKS